jgi:hypothetical protein
MGARELSQRIRAGYSIPETWISKDLLAIAAILRRRCWLYLGLTPAGVRRFTTKLISALAKWLFLLKSESVG